MRFAFNKLILIGSLSLALGACSASTGTEEASKDTAETVEAVEETEEKSIVADELTTTFYPEVTRLRHLTEEDLEWYDIIMTRLNAIDDFSGDRETVYEIAEEYGEDPEELWFDWLEIVDAKWYGDDGNYILSPENHQKLFMEIVETNIEGENIEHSNSETNWHKVNSATSVNHKIQVDGKRYTITFLVEHTDDYKVAELVTFKVNGHEIDL